MQGKTSINVAGFSNIQSKIISSRAISRGAARPHGNAPITYDRQNRSTIRVDGKDDAENTADSYLSDSSHETKKVQISKINVINKPKEKA